MMKHLSVVLLVLFAMVGCSTNVQSEHVGVSSSKLSHDYSAILGSLYHDDFNAAVGVSVNGSSRVTQWANQTSDGDAFPGVINAGDRASWAMYNPEYTESRPVYSTTSFGGAPGVTSDHWAEQLGATLTNPIPSGNRPYMWVVIDNQQLNGTYEMYFASIHDTQNGDCPVSVIEAATTIDGTNVWDVWRGDDSTDVWSEILQGSPTSSKHLIEIGFTSGGTAALVVDGTPYNSDTDGAASLDMDGLWLFGSPESSIGLKVTIARVIIAGNQPSAQQRSDMRAGLSDQYGLGF